MFLFYIHTILSSIQHVSEQVYKLNEYIAENKYAIVHNDGNAAKGVYWCLLLRAGKVGGSVGVSGGQWRSVRVGGGQLGVSEG